jgi:hypothetical protein
MTKQDIVNNLELAQKLLAEVYLYAEVYELRDLENQMSVADGCIVEAMQELK